MTTKVISGLILILTSFFQLQGQTIELRFPYFAGAPYVWYLIQGEKHDTIVNDVIPQDGIVKLTVPERYKGYVGITRWMLTHREGGGMDLIVNGEDYHVICLEPVPARENIQFVGTLENPFLNEQYFVQQQIMMKGEAIRQALQIYQENDSFYPVLRAEMNRLEEAFTAHKRLLAQSPLYAARFREMVDFTMGIGDRLEETEAEKAVALDRFVTEKMDWGALYTSNHWDGVIHHWIEMHLYVIQDDDLLLNGTRKILQRLPDNKKIYTEFAIQLVRGFSRYSKDDLLAALSPEIRQSGKLLHMDGALMVFSGIHTGDKALYIKGVSEPKKLYKGGAVVLFYETDCGNCAQAKAHFIQEYPRLQKHGVRMISISADTDPEKNKISLKELPWPDKISDNLDFEGEYFRTWGVLGTPTIFLIDQTGVVLGRYAGLTVSDALDLLGIKE